MTNDLYELNLEEISVVSGGMKWTPVENSDVIDARGGQYQGVRLHRDTGRSRRRQQHHPIVRRLRPSRRSAFAACEQAAGCSRGA